MHYQNYDFLIKATASSLRCSLTYIAKNLFIVMNCKYFNAQMTTTWKCSKASLVMQKNSTTVSDFFFFETISVFTVHEIYCETECFHCVTYSHLTCTYLHSSCMWMGNLFMFWFAWGVHDDGGAVSAKLQCSVSRLR